MIHWTELVKNNSFAEQMYAHMDDRTGEMLHFAITRINKHIDTHGAERIRMGIDPIFASNMPLSRGLEQHRLNRITAQDLIDYPVVLAYMPEHDEHLVIDGSHRYFKAATLGWPEIPAWVLSPDIWRAFLIDMPSDAVDQSRKHIVDQINGKPINSYIS